MSKLENIQKINSDAEYLREEYSRIALWGSRPDGDVKFEKLLEWISENEHIIEHMLQLSKDIKELENK